MVNVKVLAVTAIVLAVLMAGTSFAATCAIKSYTTSCMKCSFDSYGKMDQKCYEQYQNNGVACLFAAYPVESIQYKMGNCPAIDACIQKLETCKALYTSGNDKTDCGLGEIDHCFARGDACVADAVKHCDTPSPDTVADVAPPAGFCDGFFFMILPLFIGLGYVKITRNN